MSEMTGDRQAAVDRTVKAVRDTGPGAGEERRQPRGPLAQPRRFRLFWDRRRRVLLRTR